jgi:hypothetical protein|tara:strand:+ start:7261 stop:8499 length:1239 start_codon:yes stop_codon:yes gene_type:complete
MPDNNDEIGKLYFEPSTVETIDKSVLNFLKSLNLFTTTNEGWKQVPVVWATSERSFLSKNDKDIRDNLGALVFPIISVNRTSFKKDLRSPGIFQGNVPEINDKQGGSLEVGRVIYQEKTMKFANADALKLNGQNNYPRPNPKVVYRTVSAPMPVNVEIMYQITLRTEYQQQMNELMLPFVTKPGTINFVSLEEGEHRYEGFIQPDYQGQSNINDFSSQERKFETNITLKVVGYLVGEGDNRIRPHFSIRENAVEVKIPRERISLQEVPDHEFGNYYGLAGIPAFEAQKHAPFATFFSNIAARSGDAPTSVAGNSAGSALPGNVITIQNFGSVLNDNLVIREVLKDEGEDPGANDTQFSITGATIKTNTESLYKNGIILAVGASNDYTISGNDITLAEALIADDSLYITYIVE